MKVIENVLYKDNIKKIYDIFTSKLPWYYDGIVVGKKNTFDEQESKKNNDNFMYYHLAYNKDEINSDYFNLVLPLLGKLNYKKLIRVKYNSYTKGDRKIEHPFHTDYKREHKVALYSLNTNNGYTEFKNGERYESIENTMVIFDGLTEHRSVTQTDTKLRLNININYED